MSSYSEKLGWQASHSWHIETLQFNKSEDGSIDNNSDIFSNLCTLSFGGYSRLDTCINLEANTLSSVYFFSFVQSGSWVLYLESHIMFYYLNFLVICIPRKACGFSFMILVWDKRCGYVNRWFIWFWWRYSIRYYTHGWVRCSTLLLIQNGWLGDRYLCCRFQMRNQKWQISELRNP